MLKRDIGPTHYALIEEAEEHLLLDCITRSGMSSLVPIQSWANVGLNDDRFEETMLLSVDRKAFRQVLPLDDLSNQWVAFSLAEHDNKSATPQGGLLASFVSLSGGVDGVQNVQFLVTGIKAVKRQLGKLSLMVGLKNRKEEISDALDKEIGLEEFPLNIMVYDVGQGSANALVDEWGHPRVFFDLGWPTSINQTTRPSTPPDLFACEGNCTSERAPIILSHWDFDHWAYAVANTSYAYGKLAAKMTFKPQAISRPWIVPKPPRIGATKGLGPTHMRLLAALPNRIAWPNTLKTVRFSAGIVTRSDVKILPTDRNNQALAWFVMRSKSTKAILLPGDLSFDLLRWPHPAPQITGLLASHHAGLVTGILTTPLLQAAKSTAVAVSVGHGNHHKHPIPNIVAQYQAANWKPAVLTSKRIIWPPSGQKNGAILIQSDPSYRTPIFQCACIVSGNLGPTQIIP
jgi:hypothetical protein